MDRKISEKNLEKFKHRVNQYLDKEEKKRRSEEEERQVEADLEKKAKKRLNDWYEKHRVQSENSAKIIWDWYQEFIASDNFREITEPLKKTRAKEISISKVIHCKVPDSWNGERDWSRKQLLAIDMSEGERKLFVHNYVKYGKSHEITNANDLLEHVFPPVLIAIAKTITDETIWDIIDIISDQTE